MPSKKKSHVKRMGGGGAGKPMWGGGAAGKPMLGGGAAGKARFWTAGKAMIMLVVILGGLVTAGGTTYQSDQLYLQDKANTTASIPTAMISGGTQALVITATNSRGMPLENENVKVSFKDQNGTKTILYEGVTDESGSVEPIIKAPEGMAAGQKGTIIIEAGGETMTKSVSIKDTAENQAQAGKLLISTDKPIYQPEQTVRIRMLGYEGKVPVASQRPITVEVQDPDGNKIFKRIATPNDYGVSALDFPLSDQLAVGTYRITATMDGLAKTNKTIVVKRYVLPKFKIDVNGTKSWYTVDESVKGTLIVDYFFGKHVQGTATVEAKVYRGKWDLIYTKKAQLDDLGKMPFSIPPSEYAVGLDLNEGNGYMELNVTVTDTGGHQEVKSYLITIAKTPISVVLLTDTNVVGVDSTYTAICRWPTGVPVQDATVVFKVGGNTYAYPSDERGLATVTFPFNGETTMNVRVEKGDTAVDVPFELAVSEGIKIVPDRYYYTMGEEALFDVYYAGSSMTSYVYYDVVANGFTVSSGHIKIKDGKGDFKVPVDRSMSPTARIRVYKIEKDMGLSRDSVAIAVEGMPGMNVDVLPSKQTYRPGEDVTIDFNVGQNGAGVASILGINVVDLSVFELSERLVGLDEVFWTLSEDYTEPTYQILDYVYKKDTYQLDYTGNQMVPRRECGGSPVVLESSWTAHLKIAKDLKAQNIQSFWSTLFILGFAGYLGLIVLAFKFKRAAVGLVLLMLVLSMVTAGFLVTYMQDFSTGPGGTRAPEGGGWEDGAPPKGKPATANDGAAPPAVPGGMFDIFTGKETNNNADGEGQGQGQAASGGSSKPAHVRDYFPETWYWNPTLITDGSGKASITLVAPDSMTTWGVDAVASTKDARFGTGQANITVFQEFFVEPDIPVTAVRNDTFPLRILIYNYLTTDEDISVQLAPADWFTLVDGPTTKVVHVKANSVSNATFTITATKVGWKDVMVTAWTGQTSISGMGWSDAIIKPMLVEPDGKMAETINNGQLVDSSEANVTLELDPNRIPDSENAYVKLQASMEAVTVDGAEGYINYVSGCGEQSMSTLNIDVLAYGSLQKADVPPEKLAQYETTVTQGIQHELTYLLPAKNGQGRGIVWFPHDQDVHPWLTSWGLITFQDARNAGFTVDDKIISDMQKWLISQQNADGSFNFPEWGLYEFTNPILKSKKVSTTAYVMRALIYSGYDPNSAAIQKATDYIETHIEEQMNDPYTLAIAQIGLEEANGDVATRDKITDKLHDMRNYDSINSSSYWTTDKNMLSDGRDKGFAEEGRRWGYGYSDSHTIETTGYAIMAQIGSGEKVDASEGVKYLLDSRMGHGYFSTQDTVVAFQALAMAGTANVKDMNVSIYADGAFVDKVHFDKSNKDITAIIDLRPYLDRVSGSTDIGLQSDGEGKLIYQVYLSQNLPWSPDNRSQSKELELEVSYDTLDLKVNDIMTATLNMKYTGNADQLKMVLVQLKAPVGFGFVTDSLDYLLGNGIISMYELGPGEAMVYIQNIDKDTPIVFQYQLQCLKPIKGTIQGVHAFDMYNPQVDTELLPVEVTATA